MHAKTIMAAGLLASLLLGCDNTATISTVEVEKEFAPFFPVELGENANSIVEQIGLPSSLGAGDCACADGIYEEGDYKGMSVLYLEYVLFDRPGGNALDFGWELGVLTADPPYAHTTESGIRLGASRQQVERLLGKPDLQDFMVVAWENVGFGHYIQDGYLANDSVVYAVRYNEKAQLRQIEKVLLHFQGRRYQNS